MAKPTARARKAPAEIKTTNSEAEAAGTAAAPSTATEAAAPATEASPAASASGTDAPRERPEAGSGHEGTGKEAGPASNDPKTRAVLVVTAKRGCRRRAGRDFGRAETVLIAADLSQSEIDALEGDPELTTSRQERPIE